MIDKDFVFPVYIYSSVLFEIINLSKTNDNEIFGYLIGLILRWNNEKYTIIKNQIYLADSITSEKFSTSQIEGSAGEFVKEYNKLKDVNKDLLVVGWWHSHIDLGCFLSSTDLCTQENFFPESYQVALVVDPIRDEYKFFTLDSTSTLKYKVISNAVI